MSGLEQLVSAAQQRPGAQSGRPGQRHPRWTASSPPSTCETSLVRFAAFSSIIAALLANCCGARVSAVGAVCRAALGRGRQRSGRLGGGVGSTGTVVSLSLSLSLSPTVSVSQSAPLFVSLSVPLTVSPLSLSILELGGSSLHAAAEVCDGGGGRRTAAAM